MIHVNVWQNPLKCCEVISLQLIKINEKKKEKQRQMTKNKSLLQNVQPWACYLTLRQEESISLCETHIRSNVHTELLWDKICLT